MLSSILVIRKYINNKFFSNSLWMIAEKIISIFGLLFVTSYVAKYIGPANFGKLNYVASIFIIVQAISSLGSEHVLFRRIARNRISGINLMVSTTALRHISFIIIGMLVLIYLNFNSDSITFYFGVATAVAYYFSAIDIFSIYNNATLNSKLNTYCNIIGLLVGLVTRYFIVLYELDILYLTVPIISVTLIPYLLKRYLFFKNNLFFKKKIIHKKKYNLYFIKTGGPLALSSVSAILYTRMVLFIIMAYCGPKDLGVFSVANQLATSWMFITSAFIVSYFSKIYLEKNHELALNMAAKLNGLIFLCAFVILSLLMLFGGYIIDILYGADYQASYHLMLILCINTLFSCMGPVASKFIIFNSGFSYLSLKMIITLLISLPIAFFLTINFGVTGAAISTVITELLSLTVLNYFFKKGLILKLHCNSLKINTYR